MSTPILDARQQLVDLEIAIIRFCDKAIQGNASGETYDELRRSAWECARNLTRTPVRFGSEDGCEYASAIDYMIEHVHHSLGHEFERIFTELFSLIGLGDRNDQGRSFSRIIHGDANPREYAGRAVNHLEVLFIILDRLTVMERIKEDRGIRIKKSKEYRKERTHHYKEHGDLLDHAENKIEAACAAGNLNRRKVTDLIKKGSQWNGYYHAWLADPLGDHRIVYAYDQRTKTVIYQTIGTHKELGLGKF